MLKPVSYGNIFCTLVLSVHKINDITFMYKELHVLGLFCIICFLLDKILFNFIFFAYRILRDVLIIIECVDKLPEILIHSSAYSKTVVLDKLLQSEYFFLLLYLNDIMTILPINCHTEVCNRFEESFRKWNKILLFLYSESTCKCRTDKYPDYS